MKTNSIFHSVFLLIALAGLLACTPASPFVENGISVPLPETPKPEAEQIVTPEEISPSPPVATAPESEIVPSEASQIKEFQITAQRWQFTPSTITVKNGDTLKLTITSTDVTHGFSLPDFGVNEQLAPGKTVTVEFIAIKSGTFTFFCSVYCGSGHRDMKGTLIVE